MGRRVMQPRLVAYMADHAGLSYTYSGSSMTPLTWNEAVLRIKVGALPVIVAHMLIICSSLSCCGRYADIDGS